MQKNVDFTDWAERVILSWPERCEKIGLKKSVIADKLGYTYPTVHRWFSYGTDQGRMPRFSNMSRVEKFISDYEELSEKWESKK